jgi:hypothetical protein
MWTLDKDW